MTRFNDKFAFVTGGANGIGRACALRLAEEGCNVCLVDREVEALKDVADELLQYGTRILPIDADCLSNDDVERAVAHAMHIFGRVDILVNNIGQSARERASLFLNSKEEVWRFVFEINLFTTLRFTRLIAPGMCERRYGRIINLTSDAAVTAPPKSADYVAAKAAVIGFTRAVAGEFGKSNVTVNAIGPGPTKTRALERAAADVVQQMVSKLAVNFVGEPNDIAGMVAHLASEDGRYITGQTILVNGGGAWV